MLVLRPCFHEKSSITLSDMLSADLDMALKVEEYMDIIDSFTELSVKQIEAEQNKGRVR